MNLPTSSSEAEADSAHIHSETAQQAEFDQWKAEGLAGSTEPHCFH